MKTTNRMDIVDAIYAMKYIIVYRYSYDIFYVNDSYELCESLDDVKNIIKRLKKKYEIIWLKVLPISSELTEHSLNDELQNTKRNNNLKHWIRTILLRFKH